MAHACSYFLRLERAWHLVFSTRLDRLAFLAPSQEQTGATACETCAAGSYSSEKEAEECIKAKAGYFVAAAGATNET